MLTEHTSKSHIFLFAIKYLFSGIAYARYSSPQCAAYAKDKLHGFEYPLGSPLHVQLAEDGQGRQEYPMNVDGGYGSAYGK